MEVVANVRMDKWLWAVRLYKTRTVAAAACVSGKVRIGGHSVKPARSVRVGEIITAVAGEISRTVKVINLVAQRLSAPLAAECYEDLTPRSEYEKPREPKFQPMIVRARGAGRPTKRDRRKIEQLWD
jgi:ribosome-associated heat shock protein Hsp15